VPQLSFLDKKDTFIHLCKQGPDNGATTGHPPQKEVSIKTNHLRGYLGGSYDPEYLGFAEGSTMKI